MVRAIFARSLLAWAVLSGIAFLDVSSVAWSVEMKDQGLSFSDEKGSFRLLSVTGTGTRADPITVTEEVTGPDMPVLVIRGFSGAFGNTAQSFHFTGFAMKKVVINHTGKTWGSYRVELREIETQHSGYGDGLSFAQGDADAIAYATSTTFPTAKVISEPEDSVTFGNAVVPPGGTAVMQFIVTDMSPVSPFYLLQEATEPISQRGMPSSLTRLAATMDPRNTCEGDK